MRFLVPVLVVSLLPLLRQEHKHLCGIILIMMNILSIQIWFYSVPAQAFHGPLKVSK